MRYTKLLIPTLTCVLAGLIASPAQGFAPFQTGLYDPIAADGDGPRFNRAAEANLSLARVTVYWARHVPAGTDKPAGFDATNPADPGYNWASVDAYVKAAAARGMDPIITSIEAPEWAEGDDAADRAKRFGKTGTYRVNAKEFGDFNLAMAKRYSGNFADPANPGTNLPRVRYYQMWNEQNFGIHLNSQKKNDIPPLYVNMLNAGYDAVKSVSKSNLVLVGGLGPFGNNGAAVDVQPQVFMRSMLCLSGVNGTKLRDKGRCSAGKPKFDIWAQHPYTFLGTPTTRGGADDAAALGNMADVKRTLDFAVKAKNAAPAGPKRLWVTEFGWASNPPGAVASNGSQLGIPLSRQASYTSETMFRLWRGGFSAFVWYGLDDHSANGPPTGLIFGEGADGDAKPVFSSLRFPFYADQSGSRVLVWGLVSGGGKSKVRIEKKSGSKWKRVVDLNTDKQGMFYDRVTGSKGSYRARAVSGGKSGAASLQFKAR